MPPQPPEGDAPQENRRAPIQGDGSSLPANLPTGDPERRARARRISYFMLFRLAMLTGFTVIAAAVFLANEGSFSRLYSAFVWGALVVGFSLTLIYAWLLPGTAKLDRLALGQAVGDIVLSAVVVQMTGGNDSGFAFLYLIAILGAAVMGDHRLCWVAAGSCAIIFGALNVLEFTSVVVPLGVSHVLPLPPLEFWSNFARTLVAMAGVSILSAYFSTQLASSASQIGSLRALNENIVRSLSSGLITLDEEGRMVYFNPVARHILSLRAEDLGRPADAVLPGFSRVLHEGRDDGRMELRIASASGRALHLGLSTAPLVDANGHRLGDIVNFQDVTRLHELAAQVRRNERLAAIGGLAASVAHEVRNPLAAISGSSELLAHARLSAEDQRLLDIIRRESSRLAVLVNDLLAFTRPKSPELVRIDLFRAAAEASDAFRSDPANAKIEIHFTGESSTFANVDPAQLTQVLWNLMRNASDAMGKEGRLFIDVSHDASSASIRIRDEGPGIAAEHLDRIFDPFFTTKDEGTGFGLALVHRIIEEHGGTVRAESLAGAGATFTVTLPLSL